MQSERKRLDLPEKSTGKVKNYLIEWGTDILPIVTVTLLKRYFEMFYLVFFCLAHTQG